MGGTDAWHVALHRRARQEGWCLAPVHLRLPPEQQAAQLHRVGAHCVLVGPGQDPTGARASGLPCAEAGPGGRVAATRDWDTLSPPPPAAGPRVVLQTSGTTGEPKGVELTEGMLAAHAQAAARRLGADEGSTWLCTLPLYHVGGVAMVDRCLRSGARLVTLAQPRFDAEAVARALRDETVTHVSLVPTQLRRLLAVRTPSGPPASLRCALLGGDAAPADLVAAALDAGWPVWPTYGLTEATSQVATASPDEWCLHPGTVGRPLDGVQVRVAGADARGVGEIVASGPTVAGGGPLATGDLGRLEDGRLFVTGRRADRIVSGGENVDAAEVEAVLRTHPAVVDCAVVGVPDAAWGERVVAVLVLHLPAAVAHVERWARGVLGGHQVPRAWHVVEELPRTPEGKLRRAEVRRRLQETLAQ